MKVYIVVLRIPYEGNEIFGVFGSYDGAQNHIEKLIKEYEYSGKYFKILEYEVCEEE